MTRVLKQVVAPLCPILLAAFPLLSLFAQNESDLELGVIWFPLAVCVVVSLVLYGGFLLITKQAAKAGALAALVVVAFFYFGIYVHHGTGWSLVLWLAPFLLAVVAILRTKRDVAGLTVVLLAYGALTALPQAIKIANYQHKHPGISASDPRLWPAALQTPVAPSGAKLPDIYMVIPDDYARTDVLKRYFNYDNSAFIGELRKRGFVISDQGRSPYADSESNIAAALNMDYLTNFPGVLGKRSEDVRPVKRVMQDNRASRLLKPLGYRYVHLETDDVTYSERNPDVSRLAPPDGFMNLWMRKSALKVVGGRFGFDKPATNERFRKAIGSVFSKLGSVSQGTRPNFVVFHTLLPHDPYVFGPHGQRVTFPGNTDESLASKQGRAYYLSQLQFTSRKLLEAVDRIFARSKTPPVVIIQADEGFQANPGSFGEAAMADIRVKGLTALYLPGRPRAGVPQPPNTVNTLRFVFNQYLGTHYPMLKSVSYTEGDLPYEFPAIHVKRALRRAPARPTPGPSRRTALPATAPGSRLAVARAVPRRGRRHTPRRDRRRV